MEHTEQYIKSQLFELLQSDSDNYSQILTLSNELAQMDKKNYYCPIKILQSHKIRADFICEVSPFSLDFSRQTIKSNYGQKYTF